MNRKLYLWLNNLVSRHNCMNGLLSPSEVKLCRFELTHDLDRGGVPDDVQDITHPSVVKLIRGGRKEIWIAATPYPQANKYKGEPYENTCIFHTLCSEEEIPVYFHSIKRNPIIFKDGAKYNSDCDLFYDDVDEVFYAVTRKRRAKDYLTRIVLQNSVDGQEWCKPIKLFDTDRESLCPCLFKAEDKYRMYLFNADTDYSLTENFEIWEADSLSTHDFKMKGIYKWCDPNISIWHGDVDYYKGTYYMVFCGVNTKYVRRYVGGQDKSKYLWIAKSNDGINWTHFQKPLLKMNGVYRSTFLIDDDSMIIYVSFMNRYVDENHPAGNRIGYFKIPMKLVKSFF